MTTIKKARFLVGISLFWLSGILMGLGLTLYPFTSIGWDELQRTVLILLTGASLFGIGFWILSSSIREEQKTKKRG